LDGIPEEPLGASGFSEFETYGNFVALKHQQSFRCRSLKSTRYGAELYGTDPDPCDLFCLMLFGYVFASFESWQTVSRGKVAVRKISSRIVYAFFSLFNRMTGRYQIMMDAARQIGADGKQTIN